MGTIAHVKVRLGRKLKRYRVNRDDYFTNGTFRNRRIVKIRIVGEDDEFRAPNVADFERFSKRVRLQRAIKRVFEVRY